MVRGTMYPYSSFVYTISNVGGYRPAESTTHTAGKEKRLAYDYRVGGLTPSHRCSQASERIIFFPSFIKVHVSRVTFHVQQCPIKEDKVQGWGIHASEYISEDKNDSLKLHVYGNSSSAVIEHI